MRAVHSTRVVFLALAVGFLCVVAPATAAKFDAQNAKKVDGIQATKYTTNAKKRKNKLVAANKKGVLPNNIVGLVAAATHAQSADSATSAAGLSCNACVSASQLGSSNAPSAGQVLGFNSGSLVWQNASAGTITGVTTSDGLTGGGTSGTVSVGVDATQIQSRVSGTCASGAAIQSVGQGGTVNCGTTAPSGSAGGALAGSYPNPSLNVSGGPCANGQALINVSSAASLTCAPGVYTDSSHNVAAAPNPFGSLTTGVANTAVGHDALSADTGGIANSAFGAGALANNSANGASHNSAFGQNALNGNTSGTDNSAVGFDALVDNTTGSANDAVGSRALFSNTTGSGSTAVGDNALEFNTVGGNSAFGQNALLSNTIGSSNAAFGHSALAANVSGSSNTAVGDGSLQTATVDNNSAFGQTALHVDTTGFDNTAVGADALGINTTGSENTAVGFGANPGATGSNNILLGSGAGIFYNGGESSNIDIGNRGTGLENNTIHLGTDGTSSGQQNKAFMAGVFEQNVTGAGTSAVNVNTTTGQLGITVSSRRFKRDIRPLRSQSDRLMALRPVSFRYKSRYANGAAARQYGLIAEQVAKVNPHLVTYGRNGKPLTVAYQELPALELAQLQRDHAALRRQRSRNRAQEREIAALRRAVHRGLSRQR